VYDPFTEKWTLTGSGFYSRSGATATLLLNGRVLLVGGRNDPFPLNAELYHPGTGEWYATGKPYYPRNYGTATLLVDGKVLLAGGLNFAAPLSEFRLQSAELYDPTTQVWTSTGNLTETRWGHTALLLPNGQVLVVGGAPEPTAELFDPTTETWTSTGDLFSPRFGHSATLLSNGKVLVAGGFANSSRDYTLDSAELYDPGTGEWYATGKLHTARMYHTATLLSNGKVLIVGGMHDPADFLNSAELYDPVTQVWTTTTSLNAPVLDHRATLLPNGKVLVTGGNTPGAVSTPVNSAQLYNPDTGAWVSTGSLSTPYAGHTSTLITVEYAPTAYP
jgi:N-acetylneuraminic acid mutarotase